MKNNQIFSIAQKQSGRYVWRLAGSAGFQAKIKISKKKSKIRETNTTIAEMKGFHLNVAKCKFHPRTKSQNDIA